MGKPGLKILRYVSYSKKPGLHGYCRDIEKRTGGGGGGESVRRYIEKEESMQTKDSGGVPLLQHPLLP